MVVFPDPVAPTSATVSPGSIVSSRPRSTRRLPPGYEKCTSSKRTSPRACRSTFAFGRSAIAGSVSNTSHTRPAAVSASSAIARIHASSSIGKTRMSTYDTNATRSPPISRCTTKSSRPFNLACRSKEFCRSTKWPVASRANSAIPKPLCIWRGKYGHATGLQPVVHSHRVLVVLRVEIDKDRPSGPRE